MLNFHIHGPSGTPALLFLHGFMGAADDWNAVIEKLEADFRCIAVDLPGHGASVGRAASSYSMEATAEALCDVIDHQKIDRCTPVGYSMGGRLALYFAMHHTERCEKLVLESASPGLVSEAEREVRRGVDEARALRLETDFAGFVDDWFQLPLFATLRRDEKELRRMIERRKRNDPQGLARSLREMGTGTQPSLWERLETLDVSTLALAGALDGKFAEIAEHMAVRSPKIRADLVPDTGHVIHAERPEVFVQHLQSFLSTL